MEHYQDYVIKDGKFVGAFEEMYQTFDNPWNQASKEYNENSYSRNFAVLNMKRYGMKSLIEFGCGLGYNTDFIYRRTGIKIKGIDISSTAIDRAKQLFPDLEFEVDDANNIEKYIEFDAILFAEITWYILDHLDVIFESMLSSFKGKYFIHNLVFYKGQQKYGMDFFTNLEEFINYVPFKLVGYAEATTIDDDTIETSTIFKIEKK